MYSDLERRLPLSGKSIYIEGLNLLRVVQKYCNKKVDVSKVRTCDGTGTAADPFRPTSVKQWFELACYVKKNKAVQYFAVAGRLIKRDTVHDLYFSDVGPVWRQGVGADTLAFNARVAPTYRVGAQVMRSPQDVFPQNAAWLKQAQSEQPRLWATKEALDPRLNWNNVRRQPIVIKAIRALLNGSKIELGKDYSRLQHSLPVFVCAMFIAEPARNIRAFLINLMLLDLAERNEFTVGDMFWHPQAIDVDSAAEATEGEGWNGRNAVVGFVLGPGVDRTTTAPITTLGDLHTVGGIMPASPTGGGAHAKAEALVGKKDGAAPAVVVDFIHRKEISVVVHWLSLKFAGGWAARVIPPSAGAVSASFGAVVHSDVGRVISPKLFGAAPGAAASALSLTDELKLMDNAIRDRLLNADRHV